MLVDLAQAEASGRPIAVSARGKEFRGLGVIEVEDPVRKQILASSPDLLVIRVYFGYRLHVRDVDVIDKLPQE